MNKGHKDPGNKPFFSQAHIGTSLIGSHWSFQRSKLKYWPLWTSLLLLAHSIIFRFNSFQETEKVTLSFSVNPCCFT